MKIKNKHKAYGVTVLSSSHKKVKKLKKDHTPTLHGNKFWRSSWLIVDYIKKKKLIRKNSRVIEVGCGWGLASIYCAKKHDAIVTAVDKDPSVLPYLKLHADFNDVEIKTLCRSFQRLTMSTLGENELLIGADICFWDELIDPLYNMIRRALKSGVKTVIIADPGRPTFDKLCKRCKKKFKVKVKTKDITKPVKAYGQLLIVKAKD